MFVLITYDVATVDRPGQKRLRKIAQACKDFGQRVQYSVFECRLEEAKWVGLKSRLLKIYNEKEDSLRFYHLGQMDEAKVEHYGIKPSLDFGGPLIV